MSDKVTLGQSKTAKSVPAVPVKKTKKGHANAQAAPGKTSGGKKQNTVVTKKTSQPSDLNNLLTGEDKTNEVKNTAPLAAQTAPAALKLSEQILWPVPTGATVKIVKDNDEGMQVLKAAESGAALLIYRNAASVSVANSYIENNAVEIEAGNKTEAEITAMKTAIKGDLAKIVPDKVSDIIRQKRAYLKRVGSGLDASKLVQGDYLKYIDANKADLGAVGNAALYDNLVALSNSLPKGLQYDIKQSLGGSLIEMDTKLLIIKIIDGLKSDIYKDQKKELLTMLMTVESITTNYLAEIRSAANFHLLSGKDQAALNETIEMLTGQARAALSDQIAASKKHNKPDFKALMKPYLMAEEYLRLNDQFSLASETAIVSALKTLCQKLPRSQQEKLMLFFKDGADPKTFDECGFFKALGEAEKVIVDPAEYLPTAPAPEPKLVYTPKIENKKIRSLGDVELSLAPEVINGNFNVKGAVKYTPDLLDNNFSIKDAADRYSRSIELGASTRLLNDYLHLGADYGISGNENMNSNIVAPINLQTLSLRTGVKIGGGVSVSGQGNVSNLLPSGFTLPLKLNPVNFTEADWKAGLNFNTSITDKYSLLAKLGYGQVFADPSLFSGGENKMIKKQFTDINVNIGPKTEGFYGGIGYQFLPDKEFSSIPYSFMEPFQSNLYAEVGWRGLGQERLNDIGLKVSLGSLTRVELAIGISGRKSAGDPNKRAVNIGLARYGWIDPLVMEKGEDPFRFMNRATLREAVQEHQLYMALKLIGKDAKPGKADSNKAILESWRLEMQDIIQKDITAVKAAMTASSQSVQVPAPQLEIAKYINMKELMGSDWDIIAAGNVNEAAYKVAFEKFATLGTKQDLLTGGPNSDMQLLNCAWTECIGKANATGTMKNKVAVFGDGYGVVNFYDDVYNSLVPGKIK